MNSGSVLCKCHNGRVSCADSTSTHGSFFAVYRRSESGALDSNKLKEQEALRPCTECNLAQFVQHITRYHVGYHGNVQKCAKTTGFMAIQTKRTYLTCIIKIYGATAGHRNSYKYNLEATSEVSITDCDGHIYKHSATWASR